MANVKSDEVKQSIDNLEKYRLFTEDQLKMFIHKEFDQPRGWGGGAHKHFFDRDARPRTNFNYQKNRMALNSNPKK